MTTPLDIIKQSMKDAGFLSQGETPTAEDVNDVFQKLNWMISEWSQSKVMVYHLVEKTIMANGSRTYTIGPGGDIDFAVRPNEIDSAVYRISPAGGYPTDVPMDVIRAFEDYQTISVKNISAPPRVVFLDTGWPLGTIYVWPVPQAGQYELKFLFKMVLSGFTSLYETISLPPMYESAMNWNLAKRIAPMTGEQGANPIIAAEAASTLRSLKRVNNQLRRLRMPAGIPKRGYFDAMIGLWR